MNYYIIYDYLNKNVEFNSMSGEKKHQLASLFCTIYDLYNGSSIEHSYILDIDWCMRYYFHPENKLTADEFISLLDKLDNYEKMLYNYMCNQLI